MPSVVEVCGGGLTVTRNVDAGPVRAAVAVAVGVLRTAKGATGLALAKSR
jgi:hypothetical protein